jgi:membrane fusion protein (multidrug efflux system)
MPLPDRPRHDAPSRASLPVARGSHSILTSTLREFDPKGEQDALRRSAAVATIADAQDERLRHMNHRPLPLRVLATCSSLLLAACHTNHAKEGHEEERHKIVVTTPISEDVVSTQQYVCQIHSRRHIEVRALETGYLKEIHVREGQAVKQGDVLFEVVPVLYQANLAKEQAEAQVAAIKYDNTSLLSSKSVVSAQELAMSGAELAKARAQVTKARAELNFTSLRAPFDGIIDRQREQQGSLVEEGGILSTLSDNSVMWVYFNVPEARYLEYRARLEKEEHGLEVELKLANGSVFPKQGKIGAIEADFNNETGNIPFRADFDNPNNLLRHGQTGTILIHRKLQDAIVIPQRATFEILAKRYVFVIESPKEGAGADKNTGVVRQREISIQDEKDDIYVINKGLTASDRIVFEGIRQVRDGDTAEYELRPPREILDHLKFHAE